MKFISTRSSSEVSFTFEDAILQGYAPDGGLFVPATIPQINSETLERWSGLSFTNLACEILKLFVGEDEVPHEDIDRICSKAYRGFQRDDMVPVLPLAGGVFVAELFHGPTFCFKDFGLRIVINFMAYFAEKRRQRITLLVATTGDTGPAAVKAVEDSGSKFLSIVVHYPHGQISDFQRKQLTTVNSQQVKIVEFEGGGDDMDGPIKNILGSKGLGGDRLVCGVNSFNIGRPLAQIPYFVWTYLRVFELRGISWTDPTKFVLDAIVPTGAMGNLTGGYMAKKMGIPFGTFTAGVNINDITNTVFKTGSIKKSSSAMKRTLSEAINIQLPYNLERLLFYLTDGQHKLIKKWYHSLDNGGETELGSWLEVLQKEFQSARVTDDQLCVTLQHFHNHFGYIADPHTGVAFAAAQEFGYFAGSSDTSDASSKPVAVMGTASPCKFQHAVTVALGEAKWEEYKQASFPKLGLEVLSMPEIPPIHYDIKPGGSLEENQSLWEDSCVKLIESIL